MTDLLNQSGFSPDCGFGRSSSFKVPDCGSPWVGCFSGFENGSDCIRHADIQLANQACGMVN